MTKLTNDEMVKAGVFNDPTEFVHLLDFDWYWDFSEHPKASISRQFCGVYFLGFYKDKLQRDLFEDEKEWLKFKGDPNGLLV